MFVEKLFIDDVVLPHVCEERLSSTREGGSTHPILLLSIHVERKSEDKSFPRTSLSASSIQSGIASHQPQRMPRNFATDLMIIQ